MTGKRKFKPRSRRSGIRDALLIIIATEGEFTERLYIDGLLEHDKFRNPRVHLVKTRLG